MSEPPARTLRADLLPIVLLSLVSLAIYANTLGNQFVYDDREAIVKNPLIRSLTSLPTIAVSPYWPPPKRTHYRPVVVASFALNYAIGELHPFGYHLVNLLLHAGMSLLVYAVGVLAFSERGPALAVGLLFATHPIHTEAVSWVVGRSELLAAFFFLGAWVLYHRADGWSGRRRATGRALSVLSALLALLSKEHAITLVAVLVASDACLRPGLLRGSSPGQLARRYGPYLAVTGLYLLSRRLVLGMWLDVPPSPVANPLATASLLVRLLTATDVFGRYMRLLLLPYHLSVDYSYNQIPLAASFWESGVLLGLVSLAALLLATAWGWRRHPACALGLLVFLLPLAPVSNVAFPIGTIMGERLLYLPSLGFCLALVAAARAVVARLRARWAFAGTRAVSLGLLALVASLYASRTVLRNRDWRDEVTLFERTVQVSPSSANAHNSLALAYLRQGRLQEAAREAERAVQIAPTDANTRAYLAQIYEQQEKVAEAERETKTAIAIQVRGMTGVYKHLGIAYLRQGRLKEAKHAFEMAARLTPDSAEAHLNLGAAYAELGKLAEAERSLKQAIRLRPRFGTAHLQLAQVYERQGRSPEAEREYLIVQEISRSPKGGEKGRNPASPGRAP